MHEFAREQEPQSIWPHPAAAVENEKAFSTNTQIQMLPDPI